MYKVLIIDDEEPLREAIKILGDWELHGITEVLEAENGKEGLEAVRVQRPDIVLVDMRMPKLEGPEFLQIVESEYPDLVAIVISGYNDFNYMRQAIKSNTVDYLPKPVKKAEINKALSVAIARLEGKRKKIKEYNERNMAINMSLPMLKQHTYFSLIEKKFNIQTIKANLAYFQPDYANTSLQVILLRLLNLEKIAVTKFNQELDLLHFAVTNVINESGEEGIACYSFVHPKKQSDIFIVLTHKGNPSQAAKYEAASFIKQRIKKLEELIGIISIAAIGPVYPDPFSLNESYKIAEQIMNTINILDRKELVFNEPDEQAKLKMHSLTPKAPLMRHALEHDGRGIRHSIIKEYMRTVELSGYLGLGNAYRNQEELSMLLYDIALELGVSSEELAQVKGWIGADFEFKDAAEFERTLMLLVDRYGELIATVLIWKKAFDVNEIKSYIDRFYFQDIKISLFTEKYFISRVHLMKLFKEEFGCGIYEYAQKVRMEKAKELLNDPMLQIQVISELVGYSNNHYFSKAFKNYYQISPTEYRARQSDNRP
ncbi:response regulator [Cohnella nanjingensis]|uniref:Response regulator n=1 Tax=Cohnella nanjingensis TaxID=1387779 RepID=A0A7X0VDK6_9BACL|nr:response regulator [Cohnella nanjingensis]MBB6670042.1 response regulator [Cohnella nanjingensis]